MEDAPLLFPVVIPHDHDIIAQACSNSVPTVIAAWDAANAAISVAMGCQDGTIFIFHPEAPKSPSLESSHLDPNAAVKVQSPTSAKPSSAIANLTRLQRSPSPGASSNHSSFLSSATVSKHASFQPSKARTQAGVSKEQVEAPKTYVDYDNEPSKLKSLLKVREPPKERGFIERVLPTLNIGHHHHRPSSSEGHSPKLGRHPSHSQASTNHASSASTSPPTSPGGNRASKMIRPGGDSSGPADPLRLAIHAFPPRFGKGRAVTQLVPLEGGSLLASLQECGTLGIYSTADGKCISSIQISATTPIKPPSGIPLVDGGIKTVWKWHKMRLGTISDTTFLLLAATDSTTTWDDTAPKTRVTIIQVTSALERKSSSPTDYLNKIGEWIVESPIDNVGMVVDGSGNPSFYHLSSTKQIIFYQIHMLSKIEYKPPPQEEEDAKKHAINVAGTTIPIPNPFKSRKPRAQRPISVYDLRKTEEGMVELDHSTDLSDPKLGGEKNEVPFLSLGKLATGEAVVSYTDESVKVFVIRDTVLTFVEELQITAVQSVQFIRPDSLLIQTETQYHIYRLQKDGNISPELVGTLPISSPNAISTVSGSTLVYTEINSKGARKLKLVNSSPISAKSQRLWRSSLPAIKTVKITSSLPVDLTNIVVGCDDGYIRRTTLTDLFTQRDKLTTSAQPSDQPLDGLITCLRLAKNDRSGEYYIIGGTDTGVVAVWALQSLELLARWTLFATPLISVIWLLDDSVGRLKEHVLCVANGGTVAVLSLDGLEISFLIPGGPDRLEKIALGEDNLMLIYSNDMVRLWDVKTQEFWRSMTREKAEELLEQGGWFETLVEPEGPLFTSSTMGCGERSFATYDGACTFVLNIRNLLASASGQNLGNVANPQLESPDKRSVAVTAKQREFLGPFISTCLSFGLDESIDETICDAFSINAAQTSCGLCSFGNTPSLIDTTSPASTWTLSPEYTAWRLLTIGSLLRASLNIEDISNDVNTALVYYVASLPEAVGARYCAPSLEVLARFWFDSSPEIRLTTRALFDAAVGLLSDDEVIKLATDYQHRLPCLQPDAHKESPWAVISLLVVGGLAIARHAALPPGIMTDIATSIAMYLHDELSSHRVVGIDLSSRGFQIWQAYTDTMEILRSLFELATSVKKESDVPTIRNPGAQARLAVLHIASTNTHLFMTKLLLDIMNPKTPEHSRSIMQLLAFLIRKKPLVLYPSLSRVVEAVVKSMDPNSTFRDTVFDAATQILGEVVKTYPSVDFHTTSQKLVVGTQEGAAVLYDLKTATRLYVLEGHKKRLAACSFSPDGRRLVTLSLEESVVMVWKVGSSFTSFFYPGAPPRQGHSGSEPFKTLSFNVGSEAYMTTAATLEWVGFDWPTERTARLRIRDSTLTFNT